VSLVTLISVDLRRGLCAARFAIENTTNLSPFLFVPRAPPDSSTLRTFDFVNYNISTSEYTPS
jgi:hypothetical protein